MYIFAIDYIKLKDYGIEYDTIIFIKLSKKVINFSRIVDNVHHKSSLISAANSHANSGF